MTETKEVSQSPFCQTKDVKSPLWRSETKEVSQSPLRMTETKEVSQSPLRMTETKGSIRGEVYEEIELSKAQNPQIETCHHV
jgi:hypothetical protein